ncbi:MAG TPA: hypothetical protein VFB79_06160 [Candidatus Angelobacter sp.]|nr:hypothetical protein [Candidatus Angelobacter sp.]
MPMMLLLSFPEWQVSLLIELAGVCFSAGVLVTTVRVLRSDVKELKGSRDKHSEKLQEHGEAIEGLKAHTHYHG